MCSQAEVTKSLEHKIKLEQAVQSGSKKREQAERGRRIMLAAIKAIGIGALVVVIVVVLFVSVSYLKDISWESKKEHHVIVPKTFAKSNSKKQGLKLEEEKQELKAKRPKTFQKLMTEGADYETGEDWGNAIKTYKKALGIKPDNKKVQDSFVNVCLAKAKANDNKKDGKVALKVLGELLRVVPNHMGAKQLHEKISAYYVIENPLWWINKAKTIATSSKKPDYLYGCIAIAQARAGDIANAKATVAKMGNDVSTTNAQEVYIAIAVEQARLGDIEGAKDTAVKAGLGRDFEPISNAYGAIAKILVETGNTKGAKAIVTHASSNRRDTIRCAIVEAQIKTGYIIDAVNTAAMINDRTLKIKAYCDITVAYSQTKNIAEATKTLEQAKIIAKSFGDGPRSKKYNKTFSYLKIARTQAKLGDIEEAKATLSSATYRGNGLSNVVAKSLAWQLRSDKKFTIVIIEIEAGNLSNAQSLIPKILSSSLEVKALIALSKAYFKNGDINTAHEILRGAFPDQVSFQNDVVKLIIAQVELGDIAGAKNIVSRTAWLPYRVVTKHLLTKPHTDLDELSKWIEELNNEYYRACAYTGVAEGLIEKGKY